MKSLWEFRFQNYKSRAENRKGSAAIKTTEPELFVRQVGFEPATPWFVARYSIQLSYWRTLISKEASILQSKSRKSKIGRSQWLKIVKPLVGDPAHRAACHQVRTSFQETLSFPVLSWKLF